MALNSEVKRASAAGDPSYWGAFALVRPTTIGEYALDFLAPGPVPGVPELLGLTMHRTESNLALGHPGGGLSARGPGVGETTARTERPLTVRRDGVEYTTRRRGK